MSGEWVSASDVASEVHKDVFAALLELEAGGWRIRRAGHKFQVYCPCGRGGAKFSVGGTVSNPGNVARRIRRNAEHCPEHHELVT
jgi:hypothetical protein